MIPEAFALICRESPLVLFLILAISLLIAPGGFFPLRLEFNQAKYGFCFSCQYKVFHLFFSFLNIQMGKSLTA